VPVTVRPFYLPFYKTSQLSPVFILKRDFCVTALEEAIARFGKPEIFNTDQGSQFTSFAFTNTLRDADIRISMDGRGRWMDNVFIERLWRSLKYECVFLNAFETGSEARTGIGCWIGFDPTRPSAAERRRGLC
jgi:putative transposase